MGWPSLNARAMRAAARIALAALLTAAVTASFARSADAQTAVQRIREQREELDRIRRERETLRSRMDVLRGSVHDLSEEVTNLDRQADATARVVRSLDTQLEYINGEVGTTTAGLVRAQDELTGKKAVLNRRLVDIYKRGPLYSAEAMLSARSIGELVARYKYLHLLAQRDKALVGRVQLLRDDIVGQRRTLVQLQADIERNRAEKLDEEQRLRALEQQRQGSLRSTQAQATRLQTRLTAIEAAEKRLANVIGSFESARRKAETRANAPKAVTSSTIRTADLGQLDWPVDGTIIYRFGRVVNPNNTTTRWNGIGIAAAAGTPVKAIANGEVLVAEDIGTYGLTVIVQHGGGDYSVYGSLSRAAVRKGQTVRKGQPIGAVGSADPDLQPHVHFEIRRGKGAAVDPLEWLRQGRR